MAGESTADLLHEHWILFMVLLENGSSGESVSAKTVEDRGLEAAHFGHLRVHMKWVVVTIQTIEECLIWLSLLLSRVVWRSLWRIRVALLYGSLVAKSTNASDEEIGDNLRDKLTIFFILNCGLDYDNSGLFLVLEINEFILGHKHGIWFDWLEHLETLLTMEQHHWVECWDSWNRKVLEAHSVRNNHVHGGEALKLLGVLICKVVVSLFHWVLLETNTQ